MLLFLLWQRSRCIILLKLVVSPFFGVKLSYGQLFHKYIVVPSAGVRGLRDEHLRRSVAESRSFKAIYNSNWTVFCISVSSISKELIAISQLHLYFLKFCSLIFFHTIQTLSKVAWIVGNCVGIDTKYQNMDVISLCIILCHRWQNSTI